MGFAASGLSLLVLTDNERVLRLAVVATGWAFLLTVLVALRRPTDAGRLPELRRAYEIELEREVAARREYELRLEVVLRRELEEALRKDVGALRHDLVALHRKLTEWVDGNTLHTESTRLESGRPPGPGPSALAGPVDPDEPTVRSNAVLGQDRGDDDLGPVGVGSGPRRAAGATRAAWPDGTGRTDETDSGHWDASPWGASGWGSAAWGTGGLDDTGGLVPVVSVPVLPAPASPSARVVGLDGYEQTSTATGQKDWTPWGEDAASWGNLIDSDRHAERIEAGDSCASREDGEMTEMESQVPAAREEYPARPTTDAGSDGEGAGAAAHNPVADALEQRPGRHYRNEGDTGQFTRILENVPRPAEGTRRRRYREDDEENEVLARVLGR